MEIHARWWVISATVGYLLTWTAIYIISAAYGLLHFETGFEISQEMAYRPARFIGTSGGFVAIFSHFMVLLYRKYMFDAFCTKPMDRRRSFIAFFIGCMSLLGLVVVSSVQADRQNNTADNQFWVHQSGAFIGFSGLILYMYNDSFYVDLRLLKVLPGYQTPIQWKQRNFVFTAFCFSITVVSDLIQSQVVCSISEILCALSIVTWWFTMWFTLSFVSFQMKVIPEYEAVPLPKITTPLMHSLSLTGTKYRDMDVW